MSDLCVQTIDRMTPLAKRGDVDECERVVVTSMRSLPTSPFHIAIDLSITNAPESAAKHFDDFFKKESERISVKTVYTEMNGFDINTDRWFCDVFAYTNCGSNDDYDWIADWQSERFDDYTIHGLELLHDMYSSDPFYDPAFKTAQKICDLIVLVKFQAFMKTALTEMKLLNVPLYVTAHDYDLIAEFHTTQPVRSQHNSQSETRTP